MSKQLQLGTYVEDVERLPNEYDSDIPVLSSHKVRREEPEVNSMLADALGDIAQRARVSRIQATLAGLQNVYGMKLDQKTLESRAEMIMRYTEANLYTLE